MDDEAKKSHLRKLRTKRESRREEYRKREAVMAKEIYDFCENNGGHRKGLTDAYGDCNCEFCGMGM